MCKVTEDNGDIHYAQFNAKERFISTFTYISGEGRWKEMIGKKGIVTGKRCVNIFVLCL